MKKILIFSLAYYPRVGGAEVAIKEVTDRISDIEWHMVTLRFSAADAAEEKVENVHVHRVGSGESYFSKVLFVLRAAHAARRLHRQKKFDGAWVMMSYMLLPLLFSHTKLPYALTLQEGDTESHMFGRLRVLPFLPFINYGFRHAKVVQTISNYLAGWARKRGFKGPLEVVPNGVDAAHFAGEPVAHDGAVLITASRLVSKNATDVTIRALALLPEEVRFVVLGTGPEEAKLRALAKELNVESRVEFKGFVNHAELPAHLHAADIFIRPSRSEGMGNSFMEAFAAGLPVIATQEGGIKDFLFDAKRNPDKPTTGWAVDKDNPEQIAEAVKNILANPEQARAVVATAKQIAFERYDWGVITESMREKVFAPLLS